MRYYVLRMPTELKTITVKLPKSDLYKIRVKNRSEFIREAVAEKLGRIAGPADGQFKPKTPLGKKLLDLSKQFRGERLDPSAIADEIRERRGGLA